MEGEELKTFITQKEQERSLIQKEISELAIKRQIYIDEQLKKEGENKGDDLGNAITESILAVAKVKGYTAE